MKFKAKWVIAVAAIVSLLGGLLFYYGYLYKDARDISSENAAHTVTASHLIVDYNTNPKLADGKYLNATIAVKGRVTEVADSVLTLDSMIFCGFSHHVESDMLSKQIIIKGRCIGYDELFNEVKLDECSILE